MRVINYNTTAQAADVDIAIESDEPYALRDLITDEQRSITAAAGNLRLETNLDGRGVQVWEVRRE